MRRFQRPSGPELAVRESAPVAGARPVVLIHGLGGDHSSWTTVATGLRRSGRQVIAVDLRGHGRSDRAETYRLDDFRDDLRFVFDALGVERADVVAHSLGAHTALRFAIAEPSRVGRLVLEEPPPMPRDDADLAENITPSADLAERVRGLWGLAKNPVPLLRFDRRAGAQVQGEFTRADPRWWSSLSAVEAPSLVISGGERSFLPPRHLRALAEAMPRAEFTTIASGHSVHRDRPAEFLAATRAHLAE